MENRRLRVIHGHLGVLPATGFFKGTSVETTAGYKWFQPNGEDLKPGLRDSIRDVNQMPTNCDPCKPWIADISAQAAKGGMRPYGWAGQENELSEPAFAKLSKPLSECKIGLLSTSGCYVTGDLAYTYKEDPSTRSIPSDTAVEDLRFSHFTENYLVDARRDPSCVFPLATLRHLVSEGIIGSIPESVFSCMGANYSRKTVEGILAPSAADLFLSQKVDAVLVVPM